MLNKVKDVCKSAFKYIVCAMFDVILIFISPLEEYSGAVILYFIHRNINILFINRD